MTLPLRKKSNSWHTKTPSLEQKASSLISANNKSIFSDILAAKLGTHTSSFKMLKHYPTSFLLKDPILENNSSFSSKQLLNQSFSRFSKCNCCGSNSFYEQNQLKNNGKNIESLSKGKNLLMQEITKIKNFSINELKQQTRAFKPTLEPKTEKTEKSPQNSVERLPILTPQNFYQDFIPGENSEENMFLKQFFANSNQNLKKPIESTVIQAMLSLKKELPTAFSNKSMNRKEILILKKWFSNQEEILNKRTFQNLEEKTNSYFELYTLCLNEVIKEISVECNEKGEIITEIWQKFLNLLSTHRAYVEQETKKMKDSSQILIDIALKEQRMVLEKSEQMLKKKIEELAQAKERERDAYKKMKHMEITNKTYWEEGNKFRYLCKTLNDKYVNLKKDYQKLHDKMYTKKEYEERKHKPSIYVNNQTPDHSLQTTPRQEPKPQVKFKDDETPSSNNKSDRFSISTLKGVLNVDETSQQNIKVPPQIQSIFKKNEEPVETNEGLLKPAKNRKSSLSEKINSTERLPSIKELNEALSRSSKKPEEKKEKKIHQKASKEGSGEGKELIKETSIREIIKDSIKESISLNQPEHTVKYESALSKPSLRNLSIKIPETEKIEKYEKYDDSSESKESFLSNLEICGEEKNHMTIKELNGLVKMVHPDKFQAAIQENETQVEPDLYYSYHKDQMVQTNTFLLEQKYDLVFSTNREIHEFLSDYAQKKEIQQLFHDKNFADLENCETASKNVNELIEESLHSTDKFSEMKELLLSSPTNKTFEFKENDETIEQMKQGIDLTNMMISSPVLKFKTMTKTKEMVLKIMKVYLKENSKNIIFGNEIKMLNELLERERGKRESFETKYNDLLKKVENYPMLMSQSKVMSNDSVGLDDDLMEEVDDEEDKEEKEGGWKKRKFTRGMNSSVLGEKERDPRTKMVNPGIQLIQQIKSKNLAKFQNVLSTKMIYKIIYQIYQDRATLIKENPNIKEMDCPSFAYNFFIKCYGFRKMAQQKFVLFVLSLKKTMTQLRINVFSKFLGIFHSPMNYNLEEFNQYILALDFITNFTLSSNSETIQSQGVVAANKETDSRFMVNFAKSIEFSKQLEKEGEGNEFAVFKKEIEAIKEDDPKNLLKMGILDFDLFMSKYLVFFRKIKNQGKKNLVLAFRSADLNYDGFIDFFEFSLTLKWLERQFYEKEKKEGVEKHFQENADVVINSNEKHMSFNNFCCFCEDFSLFDIKRLLKFMDLTKEEEATKSFSNLSEKWLNIQKQKLANMIELIDEKQFWIDSLAKLEKKMEKAQNEEKLKLPTLISFRMLESEIEEKYKKSMEKNHQN